MNNRMIPLLTAITTAAFCFSAYGNNLLSYSRISKRSRSDVTSSTLETHFQWFKDNNVRVVSLKDNMKEVSDNRSSSTISLVFEGGYHSFLTEVKPLLSKYNYSALLLINPFNIGSHDYLTKDELNKLTLEQNIKVGIIPNRRFFKKYKTESIIQKNILEYRDKFNSLLSVPQTEEMYMNISVPFQGMDSILEATKIIPIGNVQGVLSKYNKLLHRRFVNRGNISLSQLKKNTTVQHLPITDVLPVNSYLTGSTNNPPEYGFTLMGDLTAKKSKLKCFTSNSVKMTRHNLDGGRIEFRFPRKFKSKSIIHVYCSLKNGSDVYSYARTFYVGK